MITPLFTRIFLLCSVVYTLFFMSIVTVHADAINNTDFVTTWRTSTANEQIYIPIDTTQVYNYFLDCDNNGVFEKTNITAGNNLSLGNCTFPTA